MESIVLIPVGILTKLWNMDSVGHELGGIWGGFSPASGASKTNIALTKLQGEECGHSGRCRKAEQKDYYLFLSGKTIGRSSIPSLPPFLPLFLVSTSAVVEFLHLLLINGVREVER